MSRLMHATITFASHRSHPNAVIDKLSTSFDGTHMSSFTGFTANEGDYFAWEVDTPAVPFFMIEETSPAAVNKNWEWFFAGSVDEPSPLAFPGPDGKPKSVVASTQMSAGLFDREGHTNQPSYNPHGPKVYLIARVKKAAQGQPPNKATSLQLVRNG